MSSVEEKDRGKELFPQRIPRSWLLLGLNHDALRHVSAHEKLVATSPTRQRAGDGASYRRAAQGPPDFLDFFSVEPTVEDDVVSHSYELYVGHRFMIASDLIRAMEVCPLTDQRA